jgi:hypothetical protein
MNFRHRFAALVCSLSISALAFAATDTAAENKNGNAPAANQPSSPKPTLQRGMTAEAITKLLGKPVEVRAMPSPEGKAEVWTYRRVADRLTRPVVAQVENTPAFVGVGVQNEGIGSVASPVYRMQSTVVYQITWVLMLNGKMVTAKQGREQESSYE